MPTDLHVDLDLVRRYNRPGPRYNADDVIDYFYGIKPSCRQADNAMESSNVT